MKISAFTVASGWSAFSSTSTQLVRFSSVTAVFSGIRSNADCHVSSAANAKRVAINRRKNARRISKRKFYHAFLSLSEPAFIKTQQPPDLQQPPQRFGCGGVP